MRNFKVLFLVFFALGVNSQEAPGINLPKLFSAFLSFVLENSGLVPVCNDGFKLQANGDFYECVSTLETKSFMMRPNNDVPVCPEAVKKCPANPSCASGYKILEYEEKCCCVKKDIAQNSDPVLLPKCPEAVFCPAFPLCKKAFKVLTHGENCCCLEDDDVNTEDDLPSTTQICPVCFPEEPGSIDCQCLPPMIKTESSIGSTLQCCTHA